MIGSSSTDARYHENPFAALPRLDAALVRRAGTHIMRSMAQRRPALRDWFGQKIWLDGDGVALVKLVHQPIE